MKNLLHAETSAYLLQHKDNPVHWQPWGAEALAAARGGDRPILLSIGYSACHWCHVMAHESFEDQATARLMNEHYVNIKVDREERPDLDKIYQLTHQLLARRPGGWPLTVFLAPRELLPFFSGTYFPREARLGLPSFQELLQRIIDFYRREQRGRLSEITTPLQTLLQDALGGPAASDTRLEAPPPEFLLGPLRAAFDPRHGGFGDAPKFPQSAVLDYLLGMQARGRDDGADPGVARMALDTLRGMALGGLFDQVGGGFFRYSVDERWEIPHFEKMLYDNSLLLPVYAQAWSLGPEKLLRDTALRSADWMTRVLQNKEGGFQSSLDADSEGREGCFYVWDKAELEQLLEAKQWQVLRKHFGLHLPPNFEGLHHLRVQPSTPTPEAIPEAHSDSERRILEDGLRRLLEARARRTAPGLDDKVLCSWNALAIKGLARAARILRRPELQETAERALRFTRKHLWRNGVLFTQHCKGRSRYLAYLDDHAFLLDALLELLECRWRGEDLEFAQALAETLLESFEDKEHGGFYFTSTRHEVLPARPRSFHDESLPSGNGIAARALNRLGGLLGETRYMEAARRTLCAGWPQLERNPEACCTLLAALEEFQAGVLKVVIRAPEASLEDWQAACEGPFVPHRMLLAIPDTCLDLPPGLAVCAPRTTPAAYLCRGTACQAVLTQPRELAAALAKPRPEVA